MNKISKKRTKVKGKNRVQNICSCWIRSPLSSLVSRSSRLFTSNRRWSGSCLSACSLSLNSLLTMPLFPRLPAILLAVGSFLLAVAIPTPQQTGGSTLTPESLCGNNQYDVLSGTPWIVDNLAYNADQMVGTQCTYYHSVQQPTGKNKNIAWSSVANIEYVESTYVVWLQRKTSPGQPN